MGWEAITIATAFALYRFGKIRIMKLTGCTTASDGSLPTLSNKDLPDATYFLLVLQTINGQAKTAVIVVDGNGKPKVTYYNPTSMTTAAPVYGTVMYMTE